MQNVWSFRAVTVLFIGQQVTENFDKITRCRSTRAADCVDHFVHFIIPIIALTSADILSHRSVRGCIMGKKRDCEDKERARQ